MSETLTPRPMLLRDLAEAFVCECEAAADAKRTGQPRGPVTGIPDLDGAMGGFMAPGLHLVQAAPGAGKTAILLQIASDCGCPALFVTCEMAPLVLVRRLVARQTGEYLGKFAAGEVPEAQARALIAKTAERLPNLAILDGTTGPTPAALVHDTAEALRESVGARHVLIAVDSLHIWARQTAVDAQTDYEAITAATGVLSRIGMILSAPVLAAVHRSREGQKAKADKLHASKGSGDLEYAAETLINLEREKGEGLDPHVKPVVLTVLKNRHGDTGIDFPMQFEGRLQTFR